MVKNKLPSIIIVLSALVIGWLGATSFIPRFKEPSPQEMYNQLISQRDIAIQKAVERGDYRCCIHPPCTMCYMEANQWNNYKAGTCACDDLIAEGKKPCPQCERGLCETTEDGTCISNSKNE